MEKYFNKVTVVILLVGGAVLIGVFLAWPMFQEFLRVERELDQYRAAFKGREKYVSNLIILGQRLDAKGEAIQKIKTAIPENMSIPALFDLLQNISISSGLILGKIETFEKENDFADSNLTITTVSLKAVGSYSALKTFIAQAKSSAQLLEITSISFDGKDSTGALDQESFQFTLGLQTYTD